MKYTKTIFFYLDDEELNDLDEEADVAGLLGIIEETECTPSYSQANRMRKLFQSGELNENSINNIMNEEKANQKPMFKMSMERLQKYSPKSDEKQMQEFIIKACEYYAKYLQKKRNREAR